jgi:hypothetical protein
MRTFIFALSVMAFICPSARADESISNYNWSAANPDTCPYSITDIKFENGDFWLTEVSCGPFKYKTRNGEYVLNPRCMNEAGSWIYNLEIKKMTDTTIVVTLNNKNERGSCQLLRAEPANN